ncbi:hypothetical protein B0J14DRAFT_561563 [Halenospora varia]|nr:hypothetical protein B0J14DRAFT_561563 [Halenospora varia]
MKSTRISHASISKIGISEAQWKLEETPSEPFSLPQTTGECSVNDNVVAALPVPRTKIPRALNYGSSLWGKMSKIAALLPSGEIENYFLKAVTMGETGQQMCEGEFESLKAIYAVSPAFVPKPFAWGIYAKRKLANQDTEYRGPGCKGVECKGTECQGRKH